MFASPAEGFFVVSGILIGYLYGFQFLAKTKEICRKIWKRAGYLYLLSISFTILFTIWALLLPENRIPLPTWSGDLEGFVIRLLTLRYSYGWTDFLPRYAVFMLAAPPMLYLLAKGKWWLLAAGSFLIWLLFRDNSLLSPYSAWQFLFVAGVILGHYLPQIEEWERSLPDKMKQLAYWLLVGSAGVTYLVSVIGLLVLPILTGEGPGISRDVEALFDKNILGVGRIMLGALWFGALYAMVRRNELSIQLGTKGIIEVFGRKSLFTYCAHAVLLFVVLTLFQPTGNNVFINTIIGLLVLGLMYFIVYFSPWAKRLNKVKR